MKWLVILLFLPLFSLGQQVEEFWYSNSAFAQSSNIYINSNGQANFIATNATKGSIHNSNYTPINEYDTNKLYHQFSWDEYVKRQFFFSSRASFEIIAKTNKHYLLSFRENNSFQIGLLDTSFYVERPYFYFGGPVLVKTDHDFNVINQISFAQLYFDSPGKFIETENSYLIFGRTAQLKTFNKWRNSSDTIDILNDTTYQPCFLELTKNLDSSRIIPYSMDSLGYDLSNFQSWISTSSSSSFYSPNIFEFGKHFRYISSDTLKNNFYEVRDAKNSPIYQSLDTLKCNFQIYSTQKIGARTFFTAKLNEGQNAVRVNTQPLTLVKERSSFYFLAYIDDNNKCHVIDEFDKTHSANLTRYQNEVWLKLITNSEITWRKEVIAANDTLYNTAYFKLADNGEYAAFSSGPKLNTTNFRLQNQNYWGGIQNINLCRTSEFIYDVNNTEGFLPLQDTTINGDFEFSRMQVFSKSKIIELPVYPPKLSLNFDCSNIWLNLKYFDADHYTILVSQDSFAFSPDDGNGLNYSLDYLNAPKYKNSKVMYQGSDTLVNLRNLISGNSYYLHIIPGNNYNENTVYNIDATSKLKVTLPKSTISTPLSILPDTFTATCWSDSTFATATSTYPIRWMDGITSNSRIALSSSKYYFTVKDSQACVVSSDTVTIFKYPNPIIKSIVPDTTPPFCMGDTVQFAPNNFELNRFEYPKKYGALATKTGWHVVKIETELGCITKDSVYAIFGQKPNFKFQQDSVLSMNNQIRLDYRTNADSLLWVYGVDSANGYSNYIVSDSQYLFVNAIDQSGCNIWDSILTMYKEPISEAFPNAFSPNGDGVNDEWYFLHPDTAGTLIIYDRWGGIVHHGPNYWDGKKNGEALPLGAYRYTFIYEENGEEQVKRGLINLIR